MAQKGQNKECSKESRNLALHQVNSILESITDAFVAYDRDWRFTYVNAEAERILHVLRDDLLGKTHWEVCPFTVGNEIEEFYRQVMEAREVAELEYHHQPEDRRSQRWISFRAFPAEDGGMAVYFRDITERKLAEKALRESEELYRLITDSSTDLIGLMDFQGNIVFVSPSVRQIMGLEPEQVLGTSAFNTIHPDDAAESMGEMERALAGEMVTFLHRAQHADGDWRWLDGWGKVIQFRGQPHILAVSRDITERKRAEQDLTLFRSLLDHTLDSIEVIDPETGRFLDVNEKACRACGYSRGEYLNLCVSDIDPLVAARPWRETSEKNKLLGAHIFESQHQRKDGSVFPVEVNLTYIRQEREYFLAVVRDITERKKLEEQLLQVQRIDSVGRLAGGVAHDFNNMLGVIIGRTEMAMKKLTPDQPLFATLKEIRKAAERSADLTRQLLAFARQQTVAPRLLDLNRTVEGMLKMLRRLIGEDIDFAWLPQAGVLPINIDPSQIDQILANLCVNARDAIAGVGKVTIETHRVSFDEVYCAQHSGFVPGDFVQLAVSDNGCGMDREILGKIFEPFYTTKELGKGTGLGLATVYGIVKQNNGFINVYSEPNQGTTFKVYLPWYSVLPEQTEVTAPPLPKAQKGETILLVEDEPAYLDIAQEMLESFGYQVLVAATPGEALQIAKEQAEAIHLLMTDVIMPGMNGRDLVQKMSDLSPELRHLFMSGYTSDVIAHHGVLDAGVNYIQKPFSLRDLADKVREALDRH